MKTLLLALLLIPSFVFGAELEEKSKADNSWINGKWQSEGGTAAYTLKVTGDKVEGDTLVPGRPGRKTSASIKNGKVEGDKVTFETSYLAGSRVTSNRYEFTRTGEKTLEGVILHGDGTKRPTTLTKE